MRRCLNSRHHLFLSAIGRGDNVLKDHMWAVSAPAGHAAEEKPTRGASFDHRDPLMGLSEPQSEALTAMVAPSTSSLARPS